jgi:putative redox protein
MVHGKRGSGLTADVNEGRHFIISGLLPNQGGGDEGPNPHELLESALAACTILTVQLYAERKQWKLENTAVKITISAEGLGGNVLRREVSFTGDLDAEQRARLLEIAGKCPIHLFLERGAKIETVAV